MKKVLILMVALSVLITALAVYAGTIKTGDEAPGFKLRDLDGDKFKLKDYEGKNVLVVFGATWCPACRKEIPTLKQAYKTYKDKDLVILYIDVQESKKKVKSLVEKYDIPYTVLLDIDGTVARQYGVRGIPMNVLIGPEGNILYADHVFPEKQISKIKTGKK